MSPFNREQHEIKTQQEYADLFLDAEDLYKELITFPEENISSTDLIKLKLEHINNYIFSAKEKGFNKEQLDKILVFTKNKLERITYKNALIKAEIDYLQYEINKLNTSEYK